MITMKKRWLWFLLALVSLGGLFFYLRVDNLSSPTIDYDLNDPAVVAVTQGTVGTVSLAADTDATVEIGLMFVDRDSAGVSVFDPANTNGSAVDVILQLGEARLVAGLEITLVDALPGRDTAVVRVVSADK
ncbi:MAG: hypothetical protein ACI9EW_001144 [Cellvibrionaceae bacterium]|jgi:hypothetical protein